MQQVILERNGRPHSDIIAEVKAIIPRFRAEVTVNEVIFSFRDSDDVAPIEAMQTVVYKKQTFRKKKLMLLADSDYMMLPDCPASAETVEEYTVYRQALRDLEYGQPFPKKPVYIKKRPSLFQRLFG